MKTPPTSPLPRVGRSSATPIATSLPRKATQPANDRPLRPSRTIPIAEGVWIGTSGWSYSPWRHTFYAGVPRANWLTHYASRFPTVELNASFYRILAPETYRAWRNATPTGFRFAIKGHRAITHDERLEDCVDLIRRQRDAALALGDRLAVVLWQLPRSLACDQRLLADFLAALESWRETPHAIEFRHSAWFTPQTAAQLEAHVVANVISQAPTWPRWDAVTAPFVYVRLHGDRVVYRSAYDDTTLGAWARRVDAWRDENRQVYVYLDNTMDGAAPDDATRLTALLQAD